MVNLQQLIEFDSSRHTDNEQAFVLLKKMFSYAKSFKVINNTALIIGINCDITGMLENAIIFSGHFDTVDKSSCCEFAIQNGKIFGRGSADMKSFFYCINSVFLKNIAVLNYPIIVAITFDEEIDNKGVNAVIQYIKEKYIKVKYCIVGEPTLNKCCVSSDGCYDLEIKIYGKKCHITQSSPQTDTIKNSLRFINNINELSESSNKIYIRYLNCGKSFFDSSDICEIGVEIRSKKAADFYCLLEKIKKAMPDSADCKLKILDNQMIPFDNSNSHLAKILDDCCKIPMGAFGASSEAGYYHDCGIDTIIFGPGDLREAHTDKEYIEQSKLKEYIKYLSRLILALN